MAADEYKWPTMADESRTMLESSILAYAFADLRSLDRMNLLSDDHSKLMKLPVDLKDIYELSIANEKVLNAKFSHGRLDVYKEALQDSYDRLVQEEELLEKNGEKDQDETIGVVVWDDENSDKELVYGIAVNTVEKHIVVVFRGSVTPKDFLTDVNTVLVDIPDPADPDKKIGIHKGFYDYLFKPGKDGKEAKHKQIFAHLVTLYEKYPADYKLYVTGHSLGASLATLFTAFAATSKGIPTPVTCINAASPKCGNAAFQKSFHQLVKDGLIRFLRIRNNKDIIPKMPERSGITFYRYLMGRGVVYHHVGPEVVLHEDGKHEVCFPDENGGYLYELGSELGHKVGFVGTMGFAIAQNKRYMKNHSCTEYLKRFNKFAEGKDELYLDKLSK